jgi:hypothetical protein
VRGSVAERVLRACPVTVLLVNPKGLALTDDEPRYRRVVLALDEQGLAAGGLDEAAALIARADVELSLLLPESIDRAAVRRDLEGRGLAVARVLPLAGSPGRAIVAHATEHGADLLVLSGGPRSPLSEWPLERVVEVVAREAPCPVLLLRAGA